MKKNYNDTLLVLFLITAAGHKESPIPPADYRERTGLWKRGREAYFTFALSPAPAENLMTFFAGILIAAPVCGFLPVLAFRFETE